MGQDFTRKQVAALERRYDFKTAKSLGQNFVTDPAVTEGILQAAGAGPEDLVIEVGPGLGVITSRAAQNCGKLVAIEIDKKLLPILAETVGWQPNVKILNEDFLQTDLEALVAAESLLPDGRRAEHVRLIGNLPYYITTPILNKLMALPGLFTSITIMVQKEVAEKLMAQPRAKNYGVISIHVQYYCEIEYIMDVPKEVFLPQPKVDSSVLTLHVRKSPAAKVADEAKFFEVVKAGFAQRRKTLSNALTGALGKTRDQVLAALEAAGIDPKRRAETLSIEEFAEATNRLMEQG
ncbi:MAG: 16S rRNA (adenine(1518)-N(6)/adenine(1519)-N(6))-dimethyltransferase RsmA [Clostridia bacterium]|nr:16S rRNA (adenine(1518)-N(6)/adenine(1519)-N(6))-dimethyltransferase RsmA [Clostridia bacterium]